MTAVNANTGDIAWKVTLGNYEELSYPGFKKTGAPNVGGAIATAGGVVFVAATNDSRLRAFSSKTGEELWSTLLDASGNATPMTYLGRDGQQYVVIAAGGPAHLRNVADSSPSKSDSLIAFSLRGREASPQFTTSKVKRGTSVTVSAALPDVTGKPELIRMCTPCHGTATFTRTRMTRDEWKAEVDAMIARGAKGTERDIQIVIDYLARNLSPASDR